MPFFISRALWLGAAALTVSPVHAAAAVPSPPIASSRTLRGTLHGVSQGASQGVSQGGAHAQNDLMAELRAMTPAEVKDAVCVQSTDRVRAAIYGPPWSPWHIEGAEHAVPVDGRTETIVDALKRARVLLGADGAISKALAGMQAALAESPNLAENLDGVMLLAHKCPLRAVVHITRVVRVAVAERGHTLVLYLDEPTRTCEAVAERYTVAAKSDFDHRLRQHNFEWKERLAT